MCEGTPRRSYIEFFVYSCCIDYWEKRIIYCPTISWQLSVTLSTRLQNSIKKNLPFCMIKVIFKFTTHVSNFFHFKDKISFTLRSDVVCKLSCGRCNPTDYGETCGHLNVRVGEHSGVSHLIGKNPKSKTTTAVKDHMLFCYNVVYLQDFKILVSTN